MAVVLLAVPVAFVGLLVALMRRVVVTVGVNEHAGVVEIARHTRRWRLVGLLLGGVAAVLVLVLGQRVDALGRVTALAPTVLGAGILLGTIAGELTARPSVGIRRSAAVETRTLGAILPRGRAVVLAGSTVLLVGAVTVGSSRGPWPGSFYVLPLAVALVVLAGLVAVALHAIVNRPRPELDGRGLDTLLRRWSVGNVLTAATVTVLGTLGPVAIFMASALADEICGGRAVEAVVAWTAALVGPFAIAPACGLLAGLVLTPTIRVDDLPRPLPGDVAPVGAPVR